MKLAIINGSPRKNGRTRIAAAYIAEKYQAELIDLSDGSIPLFNGEEKQNQLSAIINLRKTIASADGVILTSPEYHGGMSGALKNALDFLSSEQFAYKPVALLAVSGGGKGGINALANMRTVGRGLYANVIANQLVLDPPSFLNTEKKLTDDAAAKIGQLIAELSKYVKMFAPLH
ncbi:NAD(P)H-dependent oxidoreductase [Bacillaceae bacterium Marseille-Q3522]|nr:NAD(P)H-dependent oxidoreductase [Bacillaceae bacterium Marseille-Q3522]